MTDIGSYLGAITNSQNQEGCSGCGDEKREIKRVEGGFKFCVNCYATQFIKKPCLQCGATKRIHRHLTQGKCRECVLGPRVCQRCGNKFIKAGKVVGNLWVCASCVPYFKPMEACSICTEPSRWLARDLVNGIPEPACPKCRRVHHRTCSICRRSRPVFSWNSEAPICKACTGSTPATHFCPGCFQRINGAGSGKCNDCLAEVRFAKRLTSHSAQIGNHAFVEFFHQLCQSHKTRVGALSALRQVSGVASFIAKLGELYPVPEDINSSDLLANFSVEDLRRQSLVMGYLAVQYDVVLSNQDKLNAAEVQRIQRQLLKIADKSYGHEIKAYFEWLVARGELKPRTVRLYLQVAIQLLERCSIVVLADLPTSKKLSWVLTQYPSQYTSLTPFARWCSETQGFSIPLTKPLARSSAASRSRVLSKRVEAAFRTAETAVSLAQKKSAFAHLLHLLYGVKMSVVISIRKTDFIWADDKAFWYLGDGVVEIDQRVSSIFKRIVDADGSTEFLFEGRIPGQPMTTTSYGVRAK